MANEDTFLFEKFFFLICGDIICKSLIGVYSNLLRLCGFDQAQVLDVQALIFGTVFSFSTTYFATSFNIANACEQVPVFPAGHSQNVYITNQSNFLIAIKIHLSIFFMLAVHTPFTQNSSILCFE